MNGRTHDGYTRYTHVGDTVIGAEALPAGMYRSTVGDERIGMSGATWVKE